MPGTPRLGALGARDSTAAATVPMRTAVATLPLAAANDALARLRAGRVTGAAVLVP